MSKPVFILRYLTCKGLKESGNSPGKFLEMYFCCVPTEKDLFNTSSTSFLPQDQSGIFLPPKKHTVLEQKIDRILEFPSDL